MREDYREKLEKMFPNGWVIYYVNPNETANVSYFNPHKVSQIYEVHDYILDTRQEDEFKP